MSNRLLGMLILVLMFAGIFFMFQYFYVWNKTDVIITSNVEGYNVELYAKKLNKTFEFQCEEKKCTLKDLPFFEYSYNIKKQEYKTLQGVFYIVKGEKNPVKEIILEKEISLEVLEEKTVEISIQEKIEQLRANKKAYKVITTAQNKQFSFIEDQQGSLNIQYIGDNIGKIPLQDKETIDMLDVYGQADMFVVKSEGKYFIIDIKIKQRVQMDLEVEINYVKFYSETNNLQVVTDLGTFLVNKTTGKSEYFHYFGDFVYINDGYLGVISQKDTIRIKNLDIKTVGGKDVIYFYDPMTKKKEFIYETSSGLVKILKEENKVIIYDDQGNKQVLKNYE